MTLRTTAWVVPGARGGALAAWRAVVYPRSLSPSRPTAWVVSAALVVVGASAPVRADGALDAAVGRYEEADFDGALAALSQAEASGLSRGSYLRLLATRALVHFALGQSEPMLRAWYAHAGHAARGVGSVLGGNCVTHDIS